MSALNNRENAISISSILYPNDSTYNGKELRLKQQFFFVSATIQDVIASYKRTGRSWTEFPDYVSFFLHVSLPAHLSAQRHASGCCDSRVDSYAGRSGRRFI